MDTIRRHHSQSKQRHCNKPKIAKANNKTNRRSGIWMTEQIEAQESSSWGRFIRKHWVAFAAFVAAALLAFAGAVYVFVWFTGNAQSTGLVPASLGLWSMGNAVAFILHAIFWELVLIGIPVAVGAVIGWQWWRRLPEEEKSSYHLSGKRSRSRGAGGAISPLLFIAFAIKVFVDGNWNTAISTYTLDYVVGSMVTILLWIIAIFAIPAIVGLIWWIRHEMNKKQ
jgi:hypothetical protein